MMKRLAILVLCGLILNSVSALGRSSRDSQTITKDELQNYISDKDTATTAYYAYLYRNGKLTKEKILEAANRVSHFYLLDDYLDVDDSLLIQLNSSEEYEMIIQYMNDIIEINAPSEEDLTIEYWGDNVYYIGGSLFIVDDTNNISTLTNYDKCVTYERGWNHYMNGGFTLVNAYRTLAYAYWNNDDLDNALTSFLRVKDLVRTDWKGHPDEREELFSMDFSEDDWNVWAFEYYFSAELTSLFDLAFFHYINNNEKEAYDYWHNAFSLTKRILLHLLSSGDYSMRTQRWKNWVFYLRDFTDLSKFIRITPELSDIILNAVYFQTGFLTRMNSNIANYVYQSGDSSLINLYNEFKSAEREMERSYYYIMNQAEKRAQIENNTNHLHDISKRLLASIPNNKLIPPADDPLLSLKSTLEENDFFVQFLSYNYGVQHLLLVYDINEDGYIYRQVDIPIDYISAIVYNKSFSGVKYIQIGAIDDELSLGKGKTILDYLPAYNSNIKIDMINLPYESSALGEGIWRKIIDCIDDFDNARIFFVPSGSFNDIAIENLPLKDGTIISDKIEVHRVSSLDAIPQINNRFSSDSYGVVIGGIQYGESISTSNIRIGDTQERLSSIIDRESLGLLGGTELEMEEIYNYAPSFFLKKSRLEPNEDFFISLSGHSPSVMHIGTHGINRTYDWINPEEYEYLYGDCTYDSHNYEKLRHSDRAMYETGLLVAPSNEINTNGFLSSMEISMLDYSNTDLLSLSACSTGLGVVDSEGVNGLTLAFKRAGVGSILASLWNVNDDATRLLMREFYKNYILLGMTKYESLQKAKQYVRTYSDGGIDEYGIVNISTNQYKYSDPYYWAGFVLID